MKSAHATNLDNSPGPLFRPLLLTLLIVAFCTLDIPMAQAGAAGATVCAAIAAVMASGLAQALATIGVLMVGVGATLGKVSWTMAITIAVGISIMFGAGQVVLALSGSTGCYGN